MVYRRLKLNVGAPNQSVADAANCERERIILRTSASKSEQICWSDRKFYIVHHPQLNGPYFAFLWDMPLTYNDNYNRSILDIYM